MLLSFLTDTFINEKKACEAATNNSPMFPFHALFAPFQILLTLDSFFGGHSSSVGIPTSSRGGVWTIVVAGLPSLFSNGFETGIT